MLGNGTKANIIDKLWDSKNRVQKRKGWYEGIIGIVGRVDETADAAYTNVKGKFTMKFYTSNSVPFELSLKILNFS